VIGPHHLGVQLEDQIVRSVRDPVDLFENDVAFRLEIALAQQRPPNQVGEDFDC
jgi:hypothetical protein